MGAFTVTKQTTGTTDQIQGDKDPSVVRTVHRNYLVEYYPKEESLPAKIEEYVPHDQRHDDFYERFLEQRIGKLNSFTELLAEDTVPRPIRPLPTAAAITSHKRDSVTSQDSGFGSPQVFSRQPYPLHLNTYHNVHKRRRMNNCRLRLQPDHLHRYNNFCGTVEDPRQKKQST